MPRTSLSLNQITRNMTRGRISLFLLVFMTQNILITPSKTSLLNRIYADELCILSINKMYKIEDTKERKRKNKTQTNFYLPFESQKVVQIHNNQMNKYKKERTWQYLGSNCCLVAIFITIFCPFANFHIYFFYFSSIPIYDFIIITLRSFVVSF